MKIALRILGNILLIAFLTLLTQIGGILWLFCLALDRFIQKRYPLRGLKWLLFGALYTLITLFVVPPVARHYFGRVPLPVFDNPLLEPQGFLYSFFNRTYVKPELRKV